jgi:RsiW-degrading membrane proteinase PrsW (M82 family)
MTQEELIALLPDERLSGAFLGVSSLGHWLMALAATMMFLVFFMFLGSDGSTGAKQVLAVGLFTATIGIGLLLFLQWIGKFEALKFISFSYRAAEDDQNDFYPSFLAFTLGVGLCEELTKALPIFLHRRRDSGREWRGLMIWGMASGAGFGIAEGIIHSARHYNGYVGADPYLMRFISCVALHAIWTGSTAVLFYKRHDLFEGIKAWYGWILPTLYVLAISTILHGLYDTCVKKDMREGALIVALASFGYLAYLLRGLHLSEDKSPKWEASDSIAT